MAVLLSTLALLSTLTMAASSSSAAAASDETRNAEELLRSMETYSPIVRRTTAQRGHSIFLDSPELRARSAQIPDEVTQHFLNRAGFQCPDERVTRLISLAAHKFVADITNDAMVHSKARAAKANKEGGPPMGPVLTTEDLAASCKEYGITLRKPAYFADTPQPR